MPQAILRTSRLTLQPLADEHLRHEIDLDTDPRVHRFLTGRARTPQEVAEVHGVRMSRAQRVDGLGVWAGFAEQEFVGLWMLQPPHGPSQRDVPGEADLGYRLMPRFWRRGLASEGSRELVRLGFEELALTRIFAQTKAVNLASRATMESVGMHFVRAFHEHYDDLVPGHEQGEVEYEITRAAWLAAGR